MVCADGSDERIRELEEAAPISAPTGCRCSNGPSRSPAGLISGCLLVLCGVDQRLCDAGADRQPRERMAGQQIYDEVLVSFNCRARRVWR